MQFYELPGLLINPESIVVVNTRNENMFILHSVSGGEYHLDATQTEAFKKLVEKSSTLSLRKRHAVVEGEVGEGTVHPAPGDSFVPPIAPNHPLNDITHGEPSGDHALDVSIELPKATGPVIDASPDRSPKAEVAAKPAAKETKSEAKAESNKTDSKSK